MFRKIMATMLCAFTIISISGCSASTNNKGIYTATVESESFYISSEAAGRIVELNIQQGSEIKIGQKLAEIDARLYEIQKLQAEGALKVAKAKQSELPDSAKDSLKDQAQGNVDQAQAAVALAQLQISKCSITDFTEGIISQVFVHSGEVVSAGTNIAKAISLKNKYIKIYVEESKRNIVKLGQSIDIYVNGKKNQTGKVIYVSPESEFTPKNTETKSEKEKTLFEVKISLSEDNSAVTGMMVEAKLE